jgi:aryl-alcohol dehydrogenase-like predicted oxidoreductase
MDYKRCSNSGLKLSSVSLGTYYTIGDRCDLKESHAVVSDAFDSGINFIDTSNNYANGLAESYLGQVLSNFHRSQYVIATKVFFPIFSGPNGGGLSKKHIIESVEQSLRRLNLEYIDVLQMHRFDPNTPIEETLEALTLLQNQGKILYWATSQWSLDQLKTAIGLGAKPLWNQLPFNYFYQDNYKNCMDMKNIGIDCVLYGSLAQGVFSESYLNNTQSQNSRYFHKAAKQELYHNGDAEKELLTRVYEACLREDISLFDFALSYNDIKLSPLTTLIGSYSSLHFEKLRQYSANKREVTIKINEILETLTYE